MALSKPSWQRGDALPLAPSALTPCAWETPSGTDSVIAHWLRSNIVKPCFVAEKTYQSESATNADFPPSLHPALATALRDQGIRALYTHQADAFTLASAKRSFVIATPTASGKSLCFHLPVLDRLLRDPAARALYLYPTKALARDQEAGVRELLSSSSIVTYDGDTPADARRAARERAGIVVTNPDMLHSGILPHHAAWARTFSNLAYIVIDEMHTYRGVFGSHVANVLRRLRRVAEFHGSRPVLLGATATIGNPREHAARLFGMPEQDVAVIDQSGAPRGERKFFFLNPPVVNAELGIRASYAKQAVMLAGDLVRAKVPTIVFGQSRNTIEIMLRYLREAMTPVLGKARATESIVSYRGGYLPAQRREIERRLRDGEILCVVATNALELGIDVGVLDAVVCAAWPGSVAGMWQRFGRAGRRAGTSLCVLVASSAPLDQYLAREPAWLLGAPVEQARIDADNVEILVQHIKCGAFELPFQRGERFGALSPDDTAAALGFLEQHHVVHESNGKWHWATDAYPANEVSLRSIGWDNVVIIDQEHDRAIAELDWRSAHTMLHEQAIYQHDAETWQVERFDYENHKAYVRRVVPDYFTDAMTHTRITVIRDEARADPEGLAEVSVVEKVVGYKKIKFMTHENAGYGEVHLPEMQMHTMAYSLTASDAVCALVPGGRSAAVDALRGVGLALETVATFALMCDPRDLGVALGEPSGTGGSRDGEPTVFLYEHVPGGTGLAQRIFELRETLLSSAHSLVDTCPCAAGCPACVGPAEGSRKSNALIVLHALTALPSLGISSP